jgi:uncharacterized protein YecA (UPF0149 family)
MVKNNLINEYLRSIWLEETEESKEFFEDCVDTCLYNITDKPFYGSTHMYKEFIDLANKNSETEAIYARILLAEKYVELTRYLQYNVTLYDVHGKFSSSLLRSRDEESLVTLLEFKEREEEMESKINTLEHDVNTLTGEVRDLEKISFDLENKVNDLENELKSLEREVYE